MIETSQDLMFISIAAGVLFLSAVSGWAIYFLARILQQVFRVVKEMRDRLHKIDELLQTAKEKLEHTTSYLLLISEGVKKLVEVIKDHTGEEKKKSK